MSLWKVVTLVWAFPLRVPAAVRSISESVRDGLITLRPRSFQTLIGFCAALLLLIWLASSFWSRPQTPSGETCQVFRQTPGIHASPGLASRNSATLQAQSMPVQRHHHWGAPRKIGQSYLKGGYVASDPILSLYSRLCMYHFEPVTARHTKVPFHLSRQKHIFWGSTKRFGRAASANTCF